MQCIRMGSLHGGGGEGSHFITTGLLSKEGVGGAMDTAHCGRHS
jgi:hypothetical protein